jgi:WD40 repeat protein/tRNA A-37 threonylcarbamoyl transferase component Bud32/tetratricopeptide (TPR) repeat protein
MSDSPASAAPTPPGRPLIERLQDEQRACWQRGERVPAEALLAKHPGLEADADLALELIYGEILLREGRNEAPRLEEYLLRFPQFTAQLRDQFEVHRAMERGGLRGLEATEASGTVPGGPPPGAPPPAVRVPGYEILGELGRGGMGIVYQAWHERLRRRVAVKVLRGGALAGADERARFRIEAEAVARLEHPNIVHIHEVGEQAGQPYFVLEYIEGGSLAETLGRGPLAVPGKETNRQAAALVEALARAMDYAHRRGVVHRDLTPRNVLLAADGTPKITDFGLAKLLVGGEARTQTGAFLGTPSYVAPEQAEGRTKAIGPATDVYALGAILYECLTGRPPFQSDHPFETLRRVVADEPVPPGRLQPKVPRDLETICLKCLHKAPAQRYESAAALADDLHRFLAGEPIRARPIGAPERALKWVKRRPAVAALLGVSAFAVLALLTGAALFTRQLQEERDNADRESRKAKEQARRAEKARADALRQKTIANQEKRKALAEKRNTQRENANYRHTLYAAHTHLAYQAWLDGHTGRVLELLDGPGCPTDLRGWEWDYLRGLCHKDKWTFQAHDGRITCLAYSPDGRLLVSAGYDRRVCLWDLGRGKRLRTLRGHKGWVGQVAFNSRGRLLASASDDGTVRVWQPSGGRLVRELLPRFGWARCVAFSPDDRLLAAGGRGGTVKLWDTATWREVRVLRGHIDLVQGVAFSPDGRLLASAGVDRVVRLWDPHRGTETRALGGHANQISHVAFSPDGQTLATASEDTTVKLWETTTGREIRTFQGHTAWATWVAYSPDGRFLASASCDKTVRLWDLRRGQPVLVYRGHQNVLDCVAFSPDGRWLASADLGGTIKFWDTAGDPQEGRTLRAEPEAVTRVAFGPDGRVLASANRSRTAGTVWLWDLERGQPRRVLRGHGAEVWGLAFSPDGRRLATGSDDQTVKVWDAATGRLLRTLAGHGHWVRDVAFSADGRRLAAACYDGTITLWDPGTGRPKGRLTGHREAVVSVVFDRAGRLASGSGDGTVRLWDVAKGRLLRTLRAQAGRVFAIAVSPDGGLLASAGDGGTVNLWSPRSAKPGRILHGHTASVSALAFSPDGRRLVSASYDTTLKIWGVSSGQEILTLHKHTEILYTVAFSPDGRRLATAGGDQVIQLWEGVAAGEKPRPALGPARTRVLAWHRAQTAACVREEEWRAAAWHLDRQIPLEAGERVRRVLRDGAVREWAGALASLQNLYWWRAYARSQVGRWGQADRDYAAAIALGPGSPGPWLARAVGRLAAGDPAGYRRVRDGMGRYFAPEIKNPALHTLAWAYMLGPAGGADFTGLVRELEAAVANEPASCRFRHVLGGILYRAGRHEAAVRQLHEAMKCHPGGQGTIHDWLFLAMAHHRLGHVEQARRWLDKAAASLSAQERNRTPGQSLTGQQRTELRVLQSEAGALVKGPTPGRMP